MDANHDLDELSVEERRRRIVTILAAGLVRLSRSGGLSQKADQDGSNSSPIEPYVPGQFYRRELPCLLAVLRQLPQSPAVIVVVVHSYIGEKQAFSRLGPGYGEARIWRPALRIVESIGPSWYSGFLERFHVVRQRASGLARSVSGFSACVARCLWIAYTCRKSRLHGKFTK